MSFIRSPQYFGIQDHTVDASQPFGVRVYYPTDDDLIVGAPLASGPHPLVVFAHGYRGFVQLCPPELGSDYRRWTHVLGAIARSGFVVAAPALETSPDAAAQRLALTVQWVRTQWSGRRTLHIPPEADAGIGGALHAGGYARDAYVDVAASNLSAETARMHLPPVWLGRPTALALIGHSWGARACALLAVNGGVHALAAIAGTWDDNSSIDALRNAHIPTLLMCGTADSQTFSYLGGLWPGLSTPKYQAAFKDVDHWDWFGRRGAIRNCDGSPPAWPDSGHIAGELLVGFLTRHVARLQFAPPPFVRIPLLRPWLEPWYDQGSAIQVRWDAPGQHFFPLPPAGDGILGPWTDPPW